MCVRSLLRVVAPQSEEGKRALEMTLLTLREMAEGGIHDQTGGGFHRYSTDKFWHVPHFEKILRPRRSPRSDTSMRSRITRALLFEKTARDILDYVRRYDRQTKPQISFSRNSIATTLALCRAVIGEAQVT